MKLVIAATSKVAIPTIEALQKHHQVVLVTQPDRPAGRGKELRASEIAQHFADVLKPNNELELQMILRDTDLLLTISYGRILSEETLAIPKNGGINLHFSLLPRWRGAAPVQRAIEAGDQITGVTVFQMDRGMDTGPIWSISEFAIPYGFTSEDLFRELALLGVNVVLEALEMISKGLKPKAQEGAATVARKVNKQECAIDWSHSSDEIIRKVRAFGENPGVTSKIRGQIIKILELRSTQATMPIGELSSEGLVGTSDHAIQLLKVTPAGKRTMSISDWLNGFKPIPGERFE